VVSATVILLEESDFAGMNEEWVNGFVDPPARQAAKLPVRIPGMRVSIAAIAEGQPRGQPDAPIHGFYLASVARRAGYLTR
jgi:hypothetical protein